MSDTFDTSYAPPGLLPTDVRDLDEKFQHVRAIESTWDLPELPDETKLDLISQSEASKDSIGSFLWGLAEDINNALNPLAAQPAYAQTIEPAQSLLAQPVQQSPLTVDPFSIEGRARRVWHDVVGLRKPERISPDSVVAFKRRAVGMGLLPEGTAMDGSWSPELNGLRYEMMQEDANERLAGDKYGSFKATDALDYLAEWTDPRHLIATATELDYIPDFDQIAKEWGDWGDKWRRFREETKKGPRGISFKSAKLFIDAITGPRDDIAVPIINDLLLITGVSQVIGGMRAAQLGSKAVIGGYSVKGGGFLRQAAATGFDDVARPAEQGFLAAKFGQSAKPGLPAIGKKMDAWRQLPAVKGSKKAIQQGMRLGIVGQAESKLLSGQEYVEDIESWKQRKTLTSPLGVGFDALLLPLTPQRLIAKGAISQPSKELLQRLTQVSREAEVTTEVARGLGLEVGGMLRHKDPHAALVEWAGDEEKAGLFATWAAYVTAIDAEARATAESLVPSLRSPSKHKQAWLRMRNAKIAQLRYLDEDDVEGFVSLVGATDKTRHARRWRAKLNSPDEAVRTQAREQMAELIRDHNAKRAGNAQQLLATLTPGMVEEHVKRFFRNNDNWDNFVRATDELKQLFEQEGFLDAPALAVVDELGEVVQAGAVRYAPAFSPSRRRLNIGKTDDYDREILALAEENPDMIYRAWAMPLARDIRPGRGRFAIARKDTVTKQDAIELLSLLETQEKKARALAWLESNPKELKALAQYGKVLKKEGKSLHDLSSQDFMDALRSIYANAEAAPLHEGSHLHQAALAAKALSADGFDITLGQQAVLDARLSIETKLDELARNGSWDEFYGIPNEWDLAKKKKELKALSNVLAAEVEGLPEDKLAMFDQLGYKVVHGSEYLMPTDLTDMVQPFASVTRQQIAQMSLGTFVNRTDNEALGKLMSSKLASSLGAMLVKDGFIKGDDLARNIDQDDPALVQSIIHSLWNKVKARQGAAEDAVKQAEGGSYLERIMANGYSGFAPLGLRDLTIKQIEEALPIDIATKAMAKKVKQAILDSYDVGFRYNGLSSIEDHLRSRGALGAALKVLSKTQAATSFKNQAVGGAVIGGAFSGALSAVDGEQGDLLPDMIAGATLASVGSTMSGAVFSKTQKGLQRLDAKGWAQYTRLPEALFRLRNHLRFTLSPFFDLSRYSEAAVLSQTAGLRTADGKLVTLPARKMVKGLRETGELEEARQIWRSAQKGQFGVIEDAERYFRQKGIMGFSPFDWMASTNYRLVKQGVDPATAFEKTMTIYNYGLGRSALNKSINFVFFPFSFNKKYLTEIADFMFDDLSRTVAIHDGIKMFEVLNEHYDLQEWAEKHMPVLESMSKLNNLGRGINLGQFGGINRPFLNMASLLPVLNAFLPQMVDIRHGDDVNMLVETSKRFIPAMNDLSRMWDQLAEQGHVLADPEHQTKEAEVQAGYEEWNLIRQKYDELAKENGYEKGWISVLRDPDLEPVKQMLEQEKVALAQKYPAWQDRRAEVAGNRVQDREEIKELLIGDPTTVGDAVREFEALLDEVELYAREAGISITNDIENVPPQAFELVRQRAIDLSYREPEFAEIYKRYYARTWGPVLSEY